MKLVQRWLGREGVYEQTYRRFGLPPPPLPLLVARRQDELGLGLRSLVSLFKHDLGRVGGVAGVAPGPAGGVHGRHGAGVIVEGDLAVGENAAVA